MCYGLIWLRIRYRSMGFSNGSKTWAFKSGTILLLLLLLLLLLILILLLLLLLLLLTIIII
jgi:hypothetical protein